MDTHHRRILLASSLTCWLNSGDTTGPSTAAKGFTRYFTNSSCTSTKKARTASSLLPADRSHG